MFRMPDWDDDVICHKSINMWCSSHDLVNINCTITRWLFSNGPVKRTVGLRIEHRGTTSLRRDNEHIQDIYLYLHIIGLTPLRKNNDKIQDIILTHTYTSRNYTIAKEQQTHSRHIGPTLLSHGSCYAKMFITIITADWLYDHMDQITCCAIVVIPSAPPSSLRYCVIRSIAVPLLLCPLRPLFTLLPYQINCCTVVVMPSAPSLITLLRHQVNWCAVVVMPSAPSLITLLRHQVNWCAVVVIPSAPPSSSRYCTIRLIAVPLLLCPLRPLFTLLHHQVNCYTVVVMPSAPPLYVTSPSG